MRVWVQMPTELEVAADVFPGFALERPILGLVGLAAVVAVRVGLPRLRAMRRRAGVLKSERGFALPFALLAVVVLMIMVASAIDYTVSNFHSAVHSKQRNLSYVAAEAGLNAATAWLWNNSGQWHASSPVTVSASVGSNGLAYTYTLTPNFPIWTISVVGTAPSLTSGIQADRHTVSEQVKVGASSAGVSINLWNMYFSDVAAGAPNQCMHWNAIIEVPMYVRGDVCVDANGDSDPIAGWPPATLPGAPQLMVGAHVYLNGGHFGWSGGKMNIIQTGIGCTAYNSGAPGASHNPCSSSDSLYALSYQTGTPNLAKPVVDLATWYKDSLPGPKNACTSGTFAGGFDTDGLQNNSLGTVNLTPATAYDCKYTDGTGATVGEVKWTPGAPGTLLINGTVFWDGNLVVSSSFNYTGRATFYFGGTITLNSGVSVCGIAACATTWNTDTNMLILVSGSANQSPSWAINAAATSKMQGAMEAVGDINQNSGATMWGGLIAHQLYNLSANDNWKAFNTGTAGQPASGSYQEGMSVVPGSFKG
jgi:Tfp pilus assembly protein PilX